MANCEKCDASLDNGCSCSCEPKVCCNCCSCEPGCQCNCKPKEK